MKGPKKLKTVTFAVVCFGALALVAYAHHAFTWVKPCVGGLDCGPRCPIMCFYCFCTANWDDPGVWEGEDCVPPYCPDHEPECIIEKSNTGTCDGGSNSSLACSENGDCPGGSRDDIETDLELSLITDNIGPFTVKTEATPATTDSLWIRFMSQGSGGDTLTAASLTLDATNGPVAIWVEDGASLKTN